MCLECICGDAYDSGESLHAIEDVCVEAAAMNGGICRKHVRVSMYVYMYVYVHTYILHR